MREEVEEFEKVEEGKEEGEKVEWRGEEDFKRLLTVIPYRTCVSALNKIFCSTVQLGVFKWRHP